MAIHMKDPSKVARPIATDRMAYTLSMLMTTAVANGLLTALFTGGAPDDWKDLLAFRTGKKDEKGNPERFMLPTYMKDVYAYANAPGKTLTNKTHPLLSVGGDLIRNKDYYGTEIRHTDDNPVKQASQVLGYGVKAFVPFWMRGTQKEMERGGDALALAAPLVGVMPAPGDMNMTKAQKVARELMVSRMTVGSKTQEETDKSKLIGQLTSAFRNKDPEAIVKLNDALKARKLNRLQAGHIIQDSKLDPLVASFKWLVYHDAEKVMAVANPVEKKKLMPFMLMKRRNYYKSNPSASVGES
jgi:hypothetical protein